MSGQVSSDETVELNRLRWRCRRGMLELDYLLTTFLDKEYQRLDDRRRAAFVGLLASSDQDLHDWLVGGRDPGDPAYVSLIYLMRGKVPLKSWQPSADADGGNRS